ncbi:MAG TPA: MBL fold metallo-hydrolase [Cyanobacteria bacterium UBA11149]|nr:MBL fold metallo-hydrolase [Cyanobacteria bacterium UBA11367]HBE60970.1 MBL fold metallo-hydrolase [Cyanobacteria bacterium UBA11366]HBR77148.1 MBL fold metallo-hydrolase [Cyanobacteria bacterium UBA11159]HBS71388.1 MBL fold metallo-hydrolase [Cyanobacteria bacterium UBA11153]HBW91597.1 MBL fold metallo-hydrolase [Cyanobacteria bacterium UBA11149]
MPPSLKPPRQVLNSIFAFPPNRDTLGGTAYLILGNGGSGEWGESELKRDRYLIPSLSPIPPILPAISGNILIDCPAWDESTAKFLGEVGGVSLLFITHRGGIGKARSIQEAMGCPILIQEQEAYLLPGLNVTAFPDELTISEKIRVIWTPGHSPGSSCLYYNFGGGVLFSGRHLLPNQSGNPVPLKLSKTFHWLRQIRSVKGLIERFNSETLSYICPGANTGFLRGKGLIDRAYEDLCKLNFTQL